MHIRLEALGFVVLFSVGGAVWLSITGKGLGATPIRQTGSLVDCLVARGKPWSFAARKVLAEADPHTAIISMSPYTGTAEQNQHLAADHCDSRIGWIHPKVSPEEEKVIRAELADTARAHGVNADRFVKTAVCESRLYSKALGKRGEEGMFQFLPGEWPISSVEANNWRKAASVAARIFHTEYLKNGRVVSLAGRWSCYRKDLAYRYTSARDSQVAQVPDTFDPVPQAEVLHVQVDSMIGPGTVARIR